MTRQNDKRWSALAAIALALTLSSMAPNVGSQIGASATHAFAASAADAEREANLNKLFRKLETALDRTDARAITNEIWEAWLQSGDKAIDAEMRAVVRAMNTGQYGEALSILDEMVVKAPHYAEAWNKRATVNYLVRRYDASLHDIDKTLELEPRHFGALAGKASIHTNRGEKKAAIDAMEKALKIHPFIDGAQSLIERNGGVYRSQRGI